MRLGLAAGIALAASTAFAQTPEQPTARADGTVAVRLQQLYVTVEDGDGTRILDLGRDELEVIDDGVPQELVTFERGDVPFTAVLLVDCSLSMDGDKLETALTGARAFISGMQQYDETSVVAFSDRVRHRTPFGGSQALLGGRLGPRDGVGGSAINDHLYLALKMLETRQGRRTVILLSDGIDIESALEMREVLEKQRHSQAIIYWIRPPERSGFAIERRTLRRRGSAWRDGEGHVREFELLSQATRESGGRLVPVLLQDDLRPAFTDVLQELRDQYVLGYYPSTARHDQSWRQVEVRVRRPGLTVRTRGYLDF